MNQRANEIKLNDEQFEQLQTLYIQTVVDSMNVEELEQYVTNDMEDYCNSLTEKELISEIEYKLSDVELNEFVTEIKRGN
mgnify:FL=1|tara:strand:- start:233 stop:472 length:240 start_codon:yes stop_codon:yes gene_type:complete